ncbi:MAG TPA: hypothetical protein DHV85_24790 [Candidatus Accumulibacter sp.]|nr:hypothetical protein [Accumulibacter sp.]
MKQLTICIADDVYDALAYLAQTQYRTPEEQAAYYLLRVMADSGRIKSIDERKADIEARLREFSARREEARRQ